MAQILASDIDLSNAPSGPKRKLKRRERNHERREQRALGLLEKGDDGHGEDSSEQSRSRIRAACIAGGAESLTPSHVTSKLEAADIAAVTAQLGYTPTNLVAIAARDTRGRPTATMLYPLARPAPERRRKGADRAFEPFPTTFWLICPLLKAKLSALEDAGWVSKLEARLAADPKAQALAKAAHAAYDACRWALLTPGHAQEVSRRGWLPALRGVGVAGIRDTSKVKCLHTQYGYWLALQERQKVRNSSAQTQRSESSEVAVNSSPQGGVGAAAAEASTCSHSQANGDSNDINARGNNSASTVAVADIDPLSCLDGIIHPVGDWIHALLLEQQANETAAEKPTASAARSGDES